jgi:hypothetical protein
MRVFAPAAAVLVILAWAGAAFSFKPQTDSVWKGWTTLAVRESVPERTVLSVCGEEGIDGVVSLGTSLRNADAGSGYQKKRENFFFDKTGGYRLYYIEGSSAGRLAGAAKRLAALGAAPAANVSSPRDFASGIAAAALFAAFVLFAKNRVVMAASGIFLAASAFMAPGAASGAASCFALYEVFLLQKVWLRRGCLSRWIKKIPSISASISVFFAVLASPSLRDALFFLLTCAASCSALCLLRVFSRISDAKKDFVPREILPARAVPIFSPRGVLSQIVPAAAAFAFSFLSLTARPLLPASDSLLLPSPVAFGGRSGFSLEAYEDFGSVSRRHNDSLPSLAEFVTLSWRELTSPYRRLGAETVSESDGPGHSAGLVAAGETVSIPEFSRSGAGAITRSDAVYVFDESFISGIIAGTGRGAGQGVPVLEDVLAGEGRFAALDYARGSARGGSASAVLLAISGIPPLAAVIFSLKRKRFDEWGN